MHFSYMLELITTIASAGLFTASSIKSQYVIQLISEKHNYTTNQSMQYCSANTTSEEESVVTDETSRWQFYISLASGVPAIFASVILTSWSDKVGRKIPLVLSLFALALSSIMELTIYIFRWPVYTLVISGAISGSMGGFIAILNFGMAYISDITTTHERAKRYTMLECGMGLAGGIANFACGYWISADGFVPSSGLATALSCVAFLLAFLLQSHPPKAAETKQEFYTETYAGRDDNFVDECDETMSRPLIIENRYAATISSRFKLIWQVYSSETSICIICETEQAHVHNGLCPHGGGIRKGRVWRIWFYLLAFNMYLYPAFGSQMFNTLYFVSYPLCFSPTFLGIRTAILYGSYALAPFIVVFWKSVMKWNNGTLLLVGITAAICINILTGFARKSYVVFLASSFAILSQLTAPILRSQISSLASAYEQGTVLSLISGTESFMKLFSSLTYSLVYPATLNLIQGFIWYYSAIFTIIALTLMIIVRIADIRRSLSKESETTQLLIST